MRNIKKIIAIITEFKQHFGIFNGLEVSLLVAIGFVVSLLEMVSIAAIVPLMLVIVEPDIIENSRYMGALYRFIGIDSHVQFAIIMSFFAIGLFTIKFIVSIGMVYYEVHVLRKWTLKISMVLFNDIINASYQKLLRYDSSFFVNMLANSVNAVILHFFQQVISLSHTCLTALFLVGFLLFYNTQTILITGGFCVSMVYILVILKRKKLRLLGAEGQRLKRLQLSTVQASIFGLKETKISLKQSFFAERVRNITWCSVKNQLTQVLISRLPTIIIEFIFIITILFMFIVILLVSDKISEAAIQISLLVFVGARLMPMLNRAVVSIQHIGFTPQTIKDICAVHQSLTPESATPATKDLVPMPFHTGINFQNISFSYQQEKDTFPVLDKVSLNIAKGQHVGLVGASGAGKSTIINIMLGFLPEFQGVFKIDETAISTQNINAFRKILSFVDQQPFLLDDDYIANIAYGEELANIDMERLKSCLEKVGLLEHAMASEAQLATKIGENGKYLSGGQKQRLAIARALYKDAQILILDEASSALDMDSEIKITELLDNLKGQITIISIAHRLSTLKNCDKIFYMEKGHIAAQGSFSELYKTQSTFKRYIDQAKIDIQ